MADDREHLIKMRQLTQEIVDNFKSILDSNELTLAAGESMITIDENTEIKTRSGSWVTLAKLYRRRNAISRRILAALQRYIADEQKELSRIDLELAKLGVKLPAPPEPN